MEATEGPLPTGMGQRPRQMNLFQQNNDLGALGQVIPIKSSPSQAKSKTELQPEYAQAMKYLILLAEGTENFTFQTFDDCKGRNKDKNMARILNGSLEEHWKILVVLNRRRAGIFVTVNETNLAGRKKTDIIKIRAIWQEDDDKGAKELPVDPHMIIESSPGKFHRYILTESTNLDEFEPVQQVLVDQYGSDPNAKDRSRVLRLPGFFHQKDRDNPHMVRIVYESGAQILSWDDVKQHFPPDSSDSKSKNTIQEYKQTDLAAHTLNILTGDNYHGSLLSLAASYIGQGVRSPKAVELLQGIMDGCNDGAKDQRWHDRRDDIPRVVESAVAKYGRGEARDIQQSSPMPLMRRAEPGEAFPIHALGSSLAETCKVMMDVIKAPAALCAQSLLAAVNLAVQPHRDVTVDGRVSPLSLFFCLIAVSGERKSEADKAALQAHRKFEQSSLEIYQKAMNDYSIEKAAFEASKKKITGQPKLSFEERKAQLVELYLQKQDEPINPTMLVTDFTYEGLFKMYLDGAPSKGLFADEGGQVTGGHGMNKEKVLATAAGLSKFWDGSRVDRIRSLDGISSLYNRRLAMHLMLQGKVGAAFINHDIMTDQGLISRVLPSWPESTIGTRTYNRKNVLEADAMKSYHKNIATFLNVPLPFRQNEDGTTTLELAPPAMSMTSKAHDRWIKFYNAIEKESGSKGVLASVAGFANKAANHCSRIAGTLQLYRKPDAGEIGLEALDNAIVITEYYLNETLRISGLAEPKNDLVDAQNILDWIHHKGLEVVTLPDVYERSTSKVRSASRARHIMQILVTHHQVVNGNPDRINPPVPTLGGKKLSREYWRTIK